jgi:hypothetical protein
LFCDNLAGRVRAAGFEPKTVGITDFGNASPLQIVRDLMFECSGAVILGLSQFQASGAMLKPGTKASEAIGDVVLATPWNQLEAGIAYALSLPLLVIREQSVRAEGIFDPQVGDYFVHQTSLTSDWLESDRFTQPFEQWANLVRVRASEATQ